MIFVLAWIGLAVYIGIRAKARGRSRAAWTAFALIFSPLVAVIFLLCCRRPSDSDVFAYIERQPDGGNHRER
jgi:hypothetical protein